jgi:diguanylate cyclase (GGDEF)-like protein/PAS domain S-box-containing protein
VYRTTNLYRDVLDNLSEGVLFLDRDLRVTFWNRGAQDITGYQGPDVVGRSCRENVCATASRSPESCGSGCAVTEAARSGTSRNMMTYLKTKDGGRVPVLARVAPIRDSENNIVGVLETFTDYSWNVAALDRIEELNRLALLDPLTGIANRRHAERSIHARLEEMRRYGVPFGLIFFDIDHFKQVNDRYGHQAGDDLLKAMARALADDLREFDSVGRWGGDEFVVIVANMHAEVLLNDLAGRLVHLVERAARGVMHGQLEATVSMGATLARPVDTVETVVSRADWLMYHSKLHPGRGVSLG